MVNTDGELVDGYYVLEDGEQIKQDVRVDDENAFLDIKAAKQYTKDQSLRYPGRGYVVFKDVVVNQNESLVEPVVQFINLNGSPCYITP